MNTANTAPTTPCPDSVPARAGTLGLSVPLTPIGLLLGELERRTGGHEIELRRSSSGEFYCVWDWDLCQPLGEGPTRAEAVANAMAET